MQYPQTISRRFAVLLLSAIACVRCGSDPPAGPTADAPKISCPTDQSIISATGQPLTVTYVLPTAMGGVAPVTVGCFPASGALFSIGATTTLCTATDAKQRTDVCRFTITVNVAPPPVVPRLTATRFLAFGDSITEGLTKGVLAPSLVQPNPAGSYPADLEALLKARYTGQTSSIAVLDEGVGGEKVSDATSRFTAALRSDAPTAVLLFEGVNDLNTSGAAAIPTVVEGLRTMVKEARSRGLPVFVGTLLPQRAGGAKAGSVTLISPANIQIRAMVAAEGAILVDLFDAFGGSPDPWIGNDGLHANDLGLQKIAQTFFDAIKARLETTSGT